MYKKIKIKLLIHYFFYKGVDFMEQGFNEKYNNNVLTQLKEVYNFKENELYYFYSNNYLKRHHLPLRRMKKKELLNKRLWIIQVHWDDLFKDIDYECSI
jgi:hypothetical protein